MGAPKEVLDQLPIEPDTFEVDEENWDTCLLFLRLSTQWHWIEGVCLGLNYQSVEFLFKLYETENEPDVFFGLQVMEMAALKILNTRESK